MFVQNGFSNSFANGTVNMNNGVSLDPFDTQSAHRVINAINNVHSYGYLPLPHSLHQQQNDLNNVVSAPVLNPGALFSLHLTTAATTVPSSIPPLLPAIPSFVANLQQPFAPNNFVNNLNNNNNNSQAWAALNNGSMTLKENKAPSNDFAATFDNDKKYFLMLYLKKNFLIRY